MSQPVGNCPGCGGDEPFEQIHAGTCPDTGGECPEWACVSCGAAVIMGTVPGTDGMAPAAGQAAVGQAAADRASDGGASDGQAAAGRAIRAA